MGIKIWVIIKNLGIFDENFIIFVQVELPEKNQTRKTE
jgi:hypothetical protein